jgi:hypothetical protein
MKYFPEKVVKFGITVISSFYSISHRQSNNIAAKDRKKNKLTLYPRSVSSFAGLTLFTAEKLR